MKHGIGIVGAMVLGASFLFACAGSNPEQDTGGADLTTYVAALSVNGDGSDEVGIEGMTEEASSEPLVAKGCGFQTIVENVVARFDADQNGDLDESEKAALAAEYGDAEAGISAEHPNRGQPSRAAALLDAYDSDGSGSLEQSEIVALHADIQARCEERLSSLIEQFDTNADGTLDDSEWQAARAALRDRIAEHRRERTTEFDTNSDGVLDAEERAALRQSASERRAEVEAEFDVDADGQLSEEERGALQEHLRTCVKADLPMDSRQVAIEHRGQRPSAGDRRPGANDTEASTDDPEETSDPVADDGASSDTSDDEPESSN